MKLRLLDNSLRLRLRKSEVVQFGEQGFLEASTAITATDAFRYRLESAPCEAITAALSPAGITVRMPQAIAEAWIAGDDVSIDGQSGPLFILIEKDFQRTAVRSLVDFDLYPNPRRVS